VTERRVQVLLACSAGGHLLQLLALRPAWEPYSRLWVTDDKSDARSLLRDERVEFAFGPPNRHPRNVLRNIAMAWRIVRRHRPEVVLTTGAGTAVPFAVVARLHGARVVYVESITRMSSPSVSCRLLAPIADRTYVQWESLAAAMPRSRYAGTIL
jgi:UDP-N-acetylglucosamine:LPS N-acetylglucosamine transferase